MQNPLANVTANGDSAVLSVGQKFRGTYQTAKVNISGGTATVTLYGRMSPADANWAVINSWTASGLIGVVLPPQIKFTVSGISGATVDAWIDCYDR